METEKSLGPISFLYRRGEYKPFGAAAPDARAPLSAAQLAEIRTLAELRKAFHAHVDARLRPQVWRYLFGYLPLHSVNEETVLHAHRADYRAFAAQCAEERLERQGDAAMLETVKLIRRDVLRTLPDSMVFRNFLVQQAMVRALTVFSARHPSSHYAQGMNDVLAPILLVFLAESLGATPDALGADPAAVARREGAEWVLAPEADAYHCFALLVSGVKTHYGRGFEGVTRCLARLARLVALADPALAEHLRRNEVETLHFGFRWVFCLLLRELPPALAAKLLDCYLVDDLPVAEKCLYLCLALLLRFSQRVKALPREQIILYLQGLPTGGWGDEDVNLLAAEAFLLRELLHARLAA